MEKQEMKNAEETGKVIVRGRPISLRGRRFEGYVIRKFNKRVTIEFVRMKFIKKYERYTKTKTKIHAYLPESMKEQIDIGDYIQVAECRPISKIVNFIVEKKIRRGGGESE